MPISLQLLLSDYERARAAGDTARASSIFKQMEKIGLPDRLKPKPKPRRGATKRGSKSSESPPSQAGLTGIKVDPGRF